MKIAVRQLEAQLRKTLAPVYVVSGDEPLQAFECLDAVRSKARQTGISARELFLTDVGFELDQLRLALESQSLFDSRRLVELRVDGRVDAALGHVIAAYAANPLPGTVLLIGCGRLQKDEQNAAWVRAVERAGIVVQVWPLEGADLLAWLEQRLAQRGLQADRAGLAAFAQRVEGNLLAAAQEIEQLYLWHGAGALDKATIQASVTDVARCTVFEIGDAALQGQARRVLRVLDLLRTEGETPAVVLWTLTRDARLVLKAHDAIAAGTTLTELCRRERVLPKRQSSLERARQRLNRRRLHTILLIAANADRIVKGMLPGDPWLALEQLALAFCGDAPLPWLSEQLFHSQFRRVAV